jgi:hypothetical protein
MSIDLTQQLRAWYSGDRSCEKRMFDEIYPVQSKRGNKGE